MKWVKGRIRTTTERVCHYVGVLLRSVKRVCLLRRCVMNVCQEGVSITKVATKECHDGVSQKGESQRCVSITKVCDYTTLLLAPYRGVIYLTLAPGVRSRWRGRVKG